MPPCPLYETLYPILYNDLLLVDICGKVGCSYCCVNCYCCRSGNAAVVKAGETAIATSNLLAELIPKYLDNVSFSQHFNCKKNQIPHSILGLLCSGYWWSGGITNSSQGALWLHLLHRKYRRWSYRNESCCWEFDSRDLGAGRKKVRGEGSSK